MASTDGSGMLDGTTAITNGNEATENTTFTIYSDFTEGMNTTMIQVVPEEENTFVLYIGGAFSLLSCVVALFTYTTSREFRVKRPYIISINLCICLIIFYIGIIISVSSARRASGPVTQSCLAGAALFELGALSTWTWTAIHWWYLTYSVLSRVTSHISHFTIKAAVPAYGLPIIITGAILIADSVSTSFHFVSDGSCVFKLNVVSTVALNILYLSSCFVVIAVCIAYCVYRLTCKRLRNEVKSTRKRIKINVIRLGVITVGIMLISILEIIRSQVSGNHPVPWFNILDGIILGLAGITVSVGLTLRSKEFRLYLGNESVNGILRSIRGKGNGESRRSSNRKSTRSVFYDEIRHPHHIPRDEIVPISFPSPRNVRRGRSIPDVADVKKRDEDLPKPIDFCSPQYDKKYAVSRMKSIKSSVVQVIGPKNGFRDKASRDQQDNEMRVMAKTDRHGINRASIYSADMMKRSSF